jgi:hypothetical protein
MFFFMLVYIRSRDELNKFYRKLIQYVIIIACIISARLLLGYVLYLYSDDINISSNLQTINSFVGAVSADYNFALLPVFFGMVGVFYFLSEGANKYNNRTLNFILVIYLGTILISGSRRGIITLAALFIFFLVVFLFSLRKNNDAAKRIWQSGRWFLINTVIIFSILTAFIFFTPLKIRKAIIDVIGINETSYRSAMSILSFKYSTVFSNKEFSYYQKRIWNEIFDPLNPDSGWGDRVSSREFPLSGSNVEIVPLNTIGYKMDSTCDASSWGNAAFSYTNITNFLQTDSLAGLNEYYYASVYCYVSHDFDGTWAYIVTEGANEGKIVDPYDLKRKGEWQKLTILFKNAGIISPVYLYWAKDSVKDFSTLKGHITFAYPEYKIVKANSDDPTVWGTRKNTQVYPLSGENVEIVPPTAIGYKMDNTCDESFWSNSAYSFTNILSLYIGDSILTPFDLFSASVFCYVSNDFDGSWANISTEGNAQGTILHAYDFNKKGTWQKLQINFSSSEGIPPVYLYWAKAGVKNFSNLKGYIIYAYPQYVMVSNKKISTSFNKSLIMENYLDFHDPSITNKNKTIGGYSHNNQLSASLIGSLMFLIDTSSLSVKSDDPIRRFADKLISEDTTYYGYKKDLMIDTVPNKLFGTRIMRWEFALQIFLKEYDLKQKILGNGFNFLNWFGDYFLNDKKASDYPHNPFLSILLYSGILGLVIYIFCLIRAIIFYIRYMRYYIVFVIFFLITLFFSFFSSGSPFDPPVMGFFIILPYFIHYSHGKT